MYRTFSFSKTKKNRLNSVAKRTEFAGRKYDSKFEAKYAANLEWRRQAGEITEIKPQHQIDIKINGKHWRNYRIDFRIVLKDGTIQYVECKGFATQEWKMKWDALHLLKDELLEPGAELILITK